MKQIYLLFTLETDAELDEWPVFEAAYSTKEKAEAARKDRQKVLDAWGKPTPYIIEETTLDDDTEG